HVAYLVRGLSRTDDDTPAIVDAHENRGELRRTVGAEGGEHGPVLCGEEVPRSLHIHAAILPEWHGRLLRAAQTRPTPAPTRRDCRPGLTMAAGGYLWYMPARLRRRTALIAFARAFKPGTPGMGRRLAAMPRLVRASLRGEYDGGMRLLLMAAA